MKKGQLSFLSIAMLVFFLTNAFTSDVFACTVDFNDQTIQMNYCIPNATNETNAATICRAKGMSWWALGGGMWGCSTAQSKAKQCAQFGGINSSNTGCNQQAKKEEPKKDPVYNYTGREGSRCEPGVQGRLCLEGFRCMGVGDPDDGQTTHLCVSNKQDDKKDAGLDVNCNPNGSKKCCEMKSGVWKDNDEGDAMICEGFARNPVAATTLKEAEVRPEVESYLSQIDAAGLKCKEEATLANNECDQETNADFKKSKDEATSAFRNLSQMAQNAGSSSMYIKTANMAAVVEIGMSAMRISCENKGAQCTKTCNEAKDAIEQLLPQLVTKAEKEKGQKTFTDIKNGAAQCAKYKGALNALVNDISKNAMARMQALIAGGCQSNSMPADLQYCCKQPTPTSCYSDPRINDPTQTAWVPPTTPNITAPTSPACLDNPALCNVTSKPTDIRNTPGGTDFGRSGGSTSGGRTGGMPSFDLGSDGNPTSMGGTQKPTDIGGAPPGGGPGGFGGGGSGLGGSGGGLAGGGNGGEHSGASGDSLFDGMRSVGGSDPNKLGGGFNGGAGGPNSLALGSAKLGVQGATAGTGKDGKPDFSKFALDPKSKLGIRGVAGATGPDGITGPDTNIWKKINSGYVNDQIYAAENVKKGK